MQVGGQACHPGLPTWLLPTCAFQLGLPIGLQQRKASRAGPAALSRPMAAAEVGSRWEAAVEKELLTLQGSFPGMRPRQEQLKRGRQERLQEGPSSLSALRQPDHGRPQWASWLSCWGSRSQPSLSHCLKPSVELFCRVVPGRGCFLGRNFKATWIGKGRAES